MQPRWERIKSHSRLWPGLTIIVLIVILQAEGNNVTEEHRCYWCGPLAEQVHRSARAQPCHHPLKMNVTCESDLHYCAIVATAHPYIESRFCVKIYQEECYPLYCNTTNTWKMVCPCRGEFCNGVNAEREIEAFNTLIKLAAKSSRSRTNKRSADNNATLRHTAADAMTASSVIENYDEVPGNALDNTDHVEFNENLSIAPFAVASGVDDEIHVLDTLTTYNDFSSVNNVDSIDVTTDGNLVRDPQVTEQNIKTGDVSNEIITTDVSKSEMSDNEDKFSIFNDPNGNNITTKSIDTEYPHLIIHNKIKIIETDFTEDTNYWDNKMESFAENAPDGNEKKKTSVNINREYNSKAKEGQEARHSIQQKTADKVNIAEKTNEEFDSIHTLIKENEYNINHERQKVFIASENESEADTEISLKKTNNSLPTAQALLQNASPSTKDNEVSFKPPDTTSPILSEDETTTQANVTTTSERDNKADKLMCSPILFFLVNSVGILFVM